MIDGYEEILDNKDIKLINSFAKEKGIKNIINYFIKDLDCTRVYPNGDRPMQTINYSYRWTLSAIKYLLELVKIKLAGNQEYVEFSITIINKVNETHKENIYFERTRPVQYYRKQHVGSGSSSKRINKVKDMFRSRDLEIKEHTTTSVITKKKETSSERKAKLINSKSISFAGIPFNPNKHEK